MKKEFDIYLGFTKQKLRTWSRWNYLNTVLGLNYSSKSIEAKLIEAKGILIASTAGEPEIKNEEAEEISDYLDEYIKLEPKKASLLIKHYSEQRPIASKISESGFTSSTYMRRLAEAENWVKHKLYPHLVL